MAPYQGNRPHFQDNLAVTKILQSKFTFLTSVAIIEGWKLFDPSSDVDLPAVLHTNSNLALSVLLR